MVKIFVTGSTGFVGKKLIPLLLEQGNEVYALYRNKSSEIYKENKPNLHYIFGDLRKAEILEKIPKDIEAAYYLVHSMSENNINLSITENNVVQNFLEGIQNTNVKQIIYLSGIINDEKNLSSHLRSRLSVEQELKKSSIPVTVLRASIIVGAGSASFEIIRDLTEKLPIMIAPKWVQTQCQPIAIDDVLYYLSGVLLNEKTFNQTFDIGGTEILTFKELMLDYAKFRKLKRWIIDIPVLTPHLSSYWLVFITSVPFSLCSYLVESMKNSTIVKLTGLEQILQRPCLTYCQALNLAFQTDASIQIQVPEEGCFKDKKSLLINDSKQATLDRIWNIGGCKGYYALDWAWHLRGFVDRIIGGIGLKRGRRHPSEIQIGDFIDFWKVVEVDKEKGILILYAEMKMPGEAWLEFRINEKNTQDYLIQIATFRPKGILGRLYWYFLVPFHFFIFQRMAKALAGKK